ncbi:MAG: thymidine phosphorylase [Longimicrobiales bacterium]
MNPYQLIARKRDGETLEPGELSGFFNAYLQGDVAEYQMSAFLMAVFFQDLTSIELNELVDVILHSGVVVDLSRVPGRKVDKHSTGGVGDKVSLVLAPLVASLGVPVPMMSGRGLGHSGGTVDKLESIPGFDTHLPTAEYRRQLQKIGCALITQTDEVAPLDKRLYALRDVTGTVESIPLIASSIMSKKLAEGIDGLVLDVKVGNGAFMVDHPRARRLALTMIDIGTRHGKEMVALLTAMDRPLGCAIGNALEIEESIETLLGRGPADLRELTIAQAAEMLVLGRAAKDLEEGRLQAAAALDDGRGADKFKEVIEAQGGNPNVVDDPALLPQADARLVVTAEKDGFVEEMDVREIGHAAVLLGAGRRSLGDTIHPGVGFHITKKTGDAVVKGEPWATVYAADMGDAERAAQSLREAVRMGGSPGTMLPLIVERLTPKDAALDYSDHHRA